MKKFLKIALLLFTAVVIVVVAAITITFPPIMAGMAAKTVCSCVYVGGRSVQSIREKELTVFPGLANAGLEVNTKDSTVTASVLLNKSKAIYRKGLGCTLLAERPEEEVRAQKIILPALSVINQDSLYWPNGNLVVDSAHANVDYFKIQKAIEEAFIETNKEKPKNTHAIVVVYNGEIIGEQYATGFDNHAKLMGWSMTKSITNALVGMLVKNGKLKVEEPAPVAEWQNDERKKITLNNLLQASSGLDWSETYFNPFEDFHKMFIHSDDKAAYAASRPLKAEPNTRFQYSSGTTNILSRIIRQQVGDSAYYRFAAENLFYKIGMQSIVLEPDASGTYVGSSYAYATARDWARFGLFFANNGNWNGKQILPEGWVRYTTTPAQTARMGEYGAQWWLNVGAKENAANRKYPALPTDAFWADGFEEQYVMVIPSKKLVVVRLGVSHHGFDIEGLVKEIIDALPK